MSNDRGVYAGAVLRCTVSAVAYQVAKAMCKKHGEVKHGDIFCSRCGELIDVVMVSTKPKFPYGHVLAERVDESVYWLPNERNWENGVLYFASNKLSSARVDCEESATIITPECIEQQIQQFHDKHADDIVEIGKHCLSCEVVWAVVPWYEF